MQTEVKRRIIWFSVFMVWIGMVGAILIYQEANPGALPSVADQEMDAQLPAVQDPAGQPTTGSDTAPDAQQADLMKRPTVKEESGNVDFFVQYRLDRDKSRSNQISTYRETINNPSADATTKKLMQEKMVQIQETVEQELQIESLIKLQGYANALAFISVDRTSMNLIILTDGLEEEDVVKISDVITDITKIRAENITIIPIMEKKMNN